MVKGEAKMKMKKFSVMVCMDFSAFNQPPAHCTRSTDADDRRRRRNAFAFQCLILILGGKRPPPKNSMPCGQRVRANKNSQNSQYNNSLAQRLQFLSEQGPGALVLLNTKPIPLGSSLCIWHRGHSDETTQKKMCQHFLYVRVNLRVSAVNI